MNPEPTGPPRRLARTLAATLLAIPTLARAQAPRPPGIALTRIASVQVDSPRYLDRPAVLPDGRIFALRLPDRKLVTLERRAGSMAAREVALPATLYVPLALAADAAGRLLVLDPSTSRVLRFTVAGSALRPAGSFAVEAGATQLCAMGGRVYVYHPAAARPVTVYSDAGAVVARFGQQFGSGSARRRESMSGGQLLCAAAERRLVVASARTGELQAWGEDGRRVWARRVSGIVAVPVLDSGNGTITLVSPPGGYHLLLSAAVLHPGSLLVQYGFRGAAQLAGYQRVETRRIDLSTGAETGRQDDLPGWLATLGESQALSLSQSNGAAVLWRIHPNRR